MSSQVINNIKFTHKQMKIINNIISYYLNNNDSAANRLYEISLESGLFDDIDENKIECIITQGINHKLAMDRKYENRRYTIDDYK